MLNQGRRFSLAEKVRHLSEHLLREIADLLVRPVARLRQGEDRRKLFCRKSAGVGAVSVGAIGMTLLPVALSVWAEPGWAREE